MSNLTGIIPFMEIVERAMGLARDTSVTSEPKFKGLVNDGAGKEIWRMEDWNFMRKSNSGIACSADYNTGTVSATAASADITGSGTTWTSGMTTANGWKIKFTGQDHVYDFEYVSATTATISPVFSGGNNISGNGYTLWRDIYSLASDFGRFLLGEHGGLKKMKGGRYRIIPVVDYQTWEENYRIAPSDNVSMCQLKGWDSSRNREVQINPGTTTALILPYDYIKILAPMTEYTTEYITTLANASTAVTGSGTDFDGYGVSGVTYYLRLDKDGTGAESVWYKISSFDSDTGITLAENYDGVSLSNGTSTTGAYTISMIPDLPMEFHDLLIYIAAMNGMADQGDPNYEYYSNKRSGILSECKMLYKSRNLNQQYGVEDDWRSFPHYET